ncbi:hypothetical protein [Nostoc sp.]|uniref:hypothetical protein n=1 Tax=Nostoc sp. TaxID=1180 RepID=UPI002FFC2E43
MESPATLGWKGLTLKMRFGLEGACQFYQELVDKIGDAIGAADGEPIGNGYLGIGVKLLLTLRTDVSR